VWLERLETANENLRAALHWSLNNRMVEIGLRLSGALWRFWQVRGYLSEGRQYLMRALATAETQAYCRERMKVLTGAGNLAHLQGDLASARRLYEESLAISRNRKDKRSQAR